MDRDSQNGSGEVSSSTKKSKDSPLFPEISADNEECDVTEIESLCMSCGENGVTRMLLTRIPFFKEVVIMSFHCPHCHHHNNELQPTGQVQKQGCRFTLTVSSKQDLNRQVVRTDTASVYIPHLDFEIPAHTQKGVLTTVEGIVARSMEGLEQDQASRRAAQPTLAQQIDGVIGRLQQLLTGAGEWTLVINDPSGNSFIQNPHAPNTDAALQTYHYPRTLEEDRQLGFVADDDDDDEKDSTEAGGEDRIGRDEVLMFNDNCSNCSAPVQSKMKVVDVPHFKSVIVMASQCEVCGNKASEVKAGSGMEPQGVRQTLTITSPPRDLCRDVIKSETCKVRIPELEFEHDTCVSGGKFTTVEGLLRDIQEQLVGKNPFIAGDSSDTDISSKLSLFAANIDKIVSGDIKNAHIILDDPAGNTYVQSVVGDSGTDPQLVREVYERSDEQNEELGLSDMSTENYTSSPAIHYL